ncbi:MAG: 50S ribosomal protein L25 [Verrucomicrobiales bacterium]|nr:50S ribosomal protein L25 [Verrucomicrobiota bacterium JB025]
MAKKTSLKAAPRARTGSGLLKQMRREGWLPSVIYGRGTESKNLKVDAKTFSELISHSTSEAIVVNLDVEGEGTSLAFLQAIQHDPISGTALHADFLAIDEKTEIQGQVPAVLVGEAPGVKTGGVIEQYVHDIEIKSIPANFPTEIEIDITKLELGESLHIGDVSFPAGVSPTQGDDVVIVHIGRAGSSDAEEETEEGAETETAEVAS